jgi:hypothetical protein
MKELTWKIVSSVQLEAVMWIKSLNPLAENLALVIEWAAQDRRTLEIAPLNDQGYVHLVRTADAVAQALGLAGFTVEVVA